MIRRTVEPPTSVDAEPGVIFHASAVLDALEEVLEEFEDHQFERARAVVARVRGEPEETAIRRSRRS